MFYFNLFLENIPATICGTILQKQYEKETRANPKTFGHKNNIKVCKSKSLILYEIMRVLKEDDENYYSEIIENKIIKSISKMKRMYKNIKEDESCDAILANDDEIEIALRIKGWWDLDRKIYQNLKKLGMLSYNKTQNMPIFDTHFMKSCQALAEDLLPKTLKFKALTERLAFAKDNPIVNDVLLNYATSIGMMSKGYNTLVSPLETESLDTYFNVKSEKKSGGSDYEYNIPCPELCLSTEGTLRDLTQGDNSHTNDPEEKQTDHFREEPLLHVFHSMYHILFNGQNSNPAAFPRNYEQFYFTHSQFIRR